MKNNINLTKEIIDIQAIDIASDLNIVAIQTGQTTKKNDNTYDQGSPAGTYVPGKDFSSNDNVSTGNLVTYTLGISMSSLSNTNYTMDKMYIELQDSTSTNQIPIYYINQDVNSQNITDDGTNTVITNEYVTGKSIVFGPNDGVKSISTISVDLNFTIPTLVYWKSKIMPKIKIVCEKDGIIKKSDVLNLTETRFTSKAILNTNLISNGDSWNKNNYTTMNGETGFLLPFSIQLNKNSIDGIRQLKDNPIFTNAEYKVKLNALLENLNITLAKSNVIIQNISSGYELVSYDVIDSELSIILNQKTSTYNLSISVYVFLPYNLNSQTEVQVGLTGKFVDDKPAINYTDFINSYIFDETTSGEFNKVTNVSFIPDPPINTLKIKENIAGALAYSKMLTSSCSFVNVPFSLTKDSKYVILLDSKIAWIDNNIMLNKVINGSASTIEPEKYTVTFASIDLVDGYDPNDICSKIVDGTILTTSYEEIDGTKRVNAVMATLNEEIGSENIADKLEIKLYCDPLLVIKAEEFNELYKNNPSQDFTSKGYSYIAVNTNLVSVEQAGLLYGSLLSTKDKFSLQRTNVYLNLGTNKLPETVNINRFNDLSIVRSDIAMQNETQNFKYGLYDMTQPVTTISDYSVEYQLKLLRSQLDSSSNSAALFKAGNVLEFSYQVEVSPYVFIGSTPYLNIYDKNTTSYKKVFIENYLQEIGTIRLTLPIDFILDKEDEIIVPVNFIVPYDEKQMLFDLKVKDDIYLVKPNSLIDGFINNNEYYKTEFSTLPTQLLSAQIDTTGLSVSPAKYSNGNNIKYIAKLLNLSFEQSDYYMAMSVPTNTYNAIETSDNTLAVYIKSIILYNLGLEVYYQTESKATTSDISAMKIINQIPSLKDYYQSTVINTWTKFINNASLPTDVVMLIAYAPNIVKNSLVRIDYDVNITVGKMDTKIYNNNSVISYYSSGSNLETRSNVVGVQNFSIYGSVTTKYLQDGTDIALAPQEELTGLIGSPYTTSAKDIADCELTKLPLNATGIFTDSPQNVIYYYEQIIDCKVIIVKYLEQDTQKELAAMEGITGKSGEAYKTTSKDIVGYDLVEIPANAEGLFVDDSQEVIYYYVREKENGIVTVKYLEETTNIVLALQEKLAGLDNTVYVTIAKYVAGYELSKIPLNATGLFKETEPQEVVYYYKKIQNCSVVVTKHMEQGTIKELAPLDIKMGKVGDSYTTTRKAIADYELAVTPQNATGTLIDEPQEVIYYYKKLPNCSVIVVKYLEEGTKKNLLPMELRTGKVGNAYTIVSKDIDKYQLVKTPENETGIFDERLQEVEYYYIAK